MLVESFRRASKIQRDLVSLEMELEEIDTIIERCNDSDSDFRLVVNREYNLRFNIGIDRDAIIVIVKGRKARIEGEIAKLKDEFEML